MTSGPTKQSRESPSAIRQALAYVYFEEEPGRRACLRLMRPGASPANIAKLPELKTARRAPVCIAVSVPPAPRKQAP